ncbi:hypothetical protein V6N12_018570 [Hibiscus sabdariffa]|uniref:Uncharacterized protein n=1 Tax=Hibiscus sabdariffa TaxID=183260 RepID=A0ABR2BY89_9ROSI
MWKTKTERKTGEKVVVAKAYSSTILDRKSPIQSVGSPAMQPPYPMEESNQDRKKDARVWSNSILSLPRVIVDIDKKFSMITGFPKLHQTRSRSTKGVNSTCKNDTGYETMPNSIAELRDFILKNVQDFHHHVSRPFYRYRKPYPAWIDSVPFPPGAISSLTDGSDLGSCRGEFPPPSEGLANSQHKKASKSIRSSGHSITSAPSVAFKDWNKAVFGNSQQAPTRLEGIQRALTHKHSDFLMKLEKDLITYYNQLLRDEELDWCPNP